MNWRLCKRRETFDVLVIKQMDQYVHFCIDCIHNKGVDKFGVRCSFEGDTVVPAHRFCGAFKRKERKL